ncbi:hypothetical protein D9M68_965440 [compost metagenome]
MAVSGSPSDHLRPSRSLKVTDFRSSAYSNDSARRKLGLPPSRALKITSASYMKSSMVGSTVVRLKTL